MIGDFDDKVKIQGLRVQTEMGGCWGSQKMMEGWWMAMEERVDGRSPAKGGSNQKIVIKGDLQGQ